MFKIGFILDVPVLGEGVVNLRARIPKTEPQEIIKPLAVPRTEGSE